MINKKEGWAWITNSPKWHYFRSWRSLCLEFWVLAEPSEGYLIGNDDGKDNCAECLRKLKAGHEEAGR